MSKQEFLQIEPQKLTKFLRNKGVPRRYKGEDVLEMVRKDEITTKELADYLLNLWADRKLHVTNVIGGEVYRSNDKGETWKKVNEHHLEHFFHTYGYSFCDIRVSPDDEDKVYICGIRFYTSDDGGRTFYHLGGKNVHVDHHALWIDPENPDRLILGNDGGLNFSYDRGNTWIDIKNMPIGEFYTISVDNKKPYNIYGGVQDNGSVYGPSNIQFEFGAEYPWKHIAGGDGFFVAVDPTNPNIVYYEYQFGNLNRKNLNTGEVENIMPKARIGEPPLRANWMTPFIISHHNPLTLYYGANRLLKSLDRGESWHYISPDLTTNPGSEKKGDVPYGTITTISESPLKPGLIYVGTDDGNVQVTKNDGATWSKISEELPQRWVSRVVASRYQEGTVFVSLTGYRKDDFSPYLYMSDNYGKTWECIVNNLPPAESINVIRENPHKRNVLYVGTDLGVYVSVDRGKTWNSMGHSLPTTPVHDLVIHPREKEMVIGTHGRSVFLMDITPVQKYKEVEDKKAYLFKPQPARVPRGHPDREWTYERMWEAIIYYYLQEPMEVEISIFDEEGNLMRRLKGTNDSGVNTAIWDLTSKEGGEIEFVSPGTYTVKIVAGGLKLEKNIQVKGSG